jgi:uncharacterized membrane protein SpoIIM required for sporulation
VRGSAGGRIAAFFARDWPRAVRSLWMETLIAVGLLALGALAAFLLVSNDPSWFGAFVPEQLAQGRTFETSTQSLRDGLYDSPGPSGLGAFATQLFTHNSQVAVLCFALGFAFGVPTFMLLVHNGTMLGAMLALYSSRGLGAEMSGWLMIHGTTELFAIALAGAAGFRIGWAVLFPGEETRLASAALAGRSAAIAMAGVVVMLFCAGLLEGFGRQLITSDSLRYGIGLAMLALWLAYFYLPRSERRG